MQLSVFKFESPEEKMLNEIRTVEIDGEIWFVASDVAKTLGYAKPSNAINTHCKSKGTLKQGIPTNSGIQEMTIINEPNVYRLIFRSQLPAAEAFETWLFEEVVPSIRKKGYYGKIDRTQLPNFYLRYKDNLHKIDRNYFSVISELFVTLNAELDKVGYEIPDKGIKGQGMYPDISVGMIFSNYLKKTDSPFEGTHKYYEHSFPDNRDDVQARMYPIEVLPTFRKFVFEKWIPENANNYFKDRDPLALDYLPKLLGK
ncbi:Bro-N domain-containing protein [Flavobacterium sp.]|uniref:BRO-N domain-containing protein n=1 Tax=Flavobacterium sp. TaxID=239 RepID=UPI00286DFFED|nr:Bro-N domain-containing protein [Flavobacterium sp.]